MTQPWIKQPPTDLEALGKDLGFGRKEIMRAKAENDEGELREKWSAKWRQAHIERPRYPARQNGHYHPAQYTSSALGAIDDAESVPVEYQNVLSLQAHSRYAEFQQTEQAQRVAERQHKQLVNKLRRLQAEAARYGVDITPRLAAMVREAETAIAEGRREAA